MIRSPLFVAGLLVAGPAAVHAQIVGRAIQFAPDAHAYAYTTGSDILTAFPQSWRDSVVGAFAGWLTSRPEALPQSLAPGSYAELSLRILRSGDLYRVRLLDSLENRVADSMLTAAVLVADEALAFPAFPVGVPGAGTEVRIHITVPRREEPRRVPVRRSLPLPRRSPACSSAVTEPNASRESTVWLLVDSTPGGPANGAWARTAMALVAETFSQPLSAALGTQPELLAESAPLDEELPAWIRVNFSSTGSLHSVELMQASGYPAIDAALLEALRRGGADGLFPPPLSTRNDTATVDLSLALGRAPSTDALRLGKVALRYWQVDLPPTISERPRVASSRVRPQSGRVTFEFVVGADGVPIAETFRVISSAHPDLTATAYSIAATTRFNPGQLRGCAIPVTVRQSVNFQDPPIRTRDVMTTRPILRP